MNLEKFRERQIANLKRYKEWCVMNIDQQIKDVDKAKTKKDIIEAMVRLPTGDDFNKFMDEGLKNGSKRNL